MIRRLIRFFGFLLIAAGLVIFVIDGARWLATKMVAPATLAQVAGELFGSRFSAWQPAVENLLHPMVWAWLLQPLLSLPAFAVFYGLGFAALWFARPPAPMIGFAPRP
ncbi:MAG: hypothetical protein ACRCTD_09750 [Beijerinckiaceae bacterium]